VRTERHAAIKINRAGSAHLAALDRERRTADTARWRSQFSANTRETRRRFWSASGADF
jgi:hypothetical protein